MSRMTTQTREDLIRLTMQSLRTIRDTARMQHLSMRFHLTHGLSVVTGEVDEVAPGDGWLVRWSIDPTPFKSPSHITLLAILLVDAALEALAGRRAKEEHHSLESRS